MAIEISDNALVEVRRRMEKEKIDGDALSWRIRAVELQLKRLREAA